MRSFLVLALAALPAISALGVSNTARCGKPFGLTCAGSAFGNCCSQYNYCGSAEGYCGDGCQSGYGTCSSSQVPPPSGNPSNGEVSRDGSCGGSKGFTCLNSEFGDCCSQYGFCGSSKAYCAAGCKADFGKCNGAPSFPSATSTAAVPSATTKVSTDGRCGFAKGATGGMTCLGSSFGDCCSQYSYCGSTEAYCATGCQAGFGNCNGTPSISSSSSSTPSMTSSSSSLATSTISESSESSTSVSSTEIPTTTSSSTESTTTSSSMESSIATTTSSSSPTSSCVATPTNAVRDGSFESGDIGVDPAGWSITTGSEEWTTFVGGAPRPGAQDGTQVLYGSTYESDFTTVIISQENVAIPSGTSVSCTGWGRGTFGSRISFQIFIGDRPCGALAYVVTETWTQFGAPTTVSGDSHTVRVEVSSYGGPGEDNVIHLFLLDHIEIVPVDGPTCDGTVSSSAVLSATTTSFELPAPTE